MLHMNNIERCIFSLSKYICTSFGIAKLLLVTKDLNTTVKSLSVLNNFNTTRIQGQLCYVYHLAHQGHPTQILII